MDFSRSWELAQATVARTEHNPQCAYVLTGGGLFCDCPAVE